MLHTARQEMALVWLTFIHEIRRDSVAISSCIAYDEAVAQEVRRVGLGANVG
jgi:hypothetical protein